MRTASEWKAALYFSQKRIGSPPPNKLQRGLTMRMRSFRREARNPREARKLGTLGTYTLYAYAG